MEYIKAQEEVTVVVAKYDDLSINEQLIKDFYNEKPRDKNVSAVQVSRMTKWWVETDAVNTIVDWVADLISKTNTFAAGHNFTIVSSWFAEYSEGDYTIPHHHFPTQYSFVYYVKTPPNSAPLVLTTSNTEIPVEEGQVVILPCGIMHHVDKSSINNRIVLAGNFYLTPPQMEVKMDGFFAGGYEWDD